MGGAFGGVTDWAQIGPAIDFDGDGLDNQTEYAWVLDPTTPGSTYNVATQAVEDLGTLYLEATFNVQGDPDLQYSVRSSGNLASWDLTNLVFDDGTNSWSTTGPASVSISGSVDNGDGTWTLTVRDSVPLVPGTPRFVSIEVL